MEIYDQYVMNCNYLLDSKSMQVACAHFHIVTHITDN